MLSVVPLSTFPRQVRNPMGVFTRNHQRHRFVTLLFHRVFRSTRKASVSVLLRRRTIQLPTHRTSTTKHSVRRRGNLVNGVGIPFRCVVVGTGRLMMSFLNRVSSFSVRTHTSVSLIRSVSRVVNLAGDHHQRSTSVLSVMVTGRLTRPRRSLASFVRELGASVVTLRCHFPVFRFSKCVFSSFRIIREQVDGSLRNRISHPSVSSARGVPNLFFRCSPRFS